MAGIALERTRLHEYPNLRSLFIPFGSNLSADDIDYLSTLENLTNIDLGFAGVSSEYVSIEGDLSALGKLRNLETLHLSKENMTDADLEFVARLPSLRRLDFNALTNHDGKSPVKLTDKCADHICQASNLKSIWAHDATMLSDKFVGRLTQGLHDLEHLDIASPLLTDESLRLLAERCKRLIWLDLSGQFTDKGVEHLAKAKELEMLWLSSNKLTSQCIKSVEELKKLKHLEFTVPTVGNDEVQILADLPKLEILALRRPELTDEQFAMFEGHPTLRSAFLNGSELSIEETLRIIESLPSLRHLSFGSNKKLQEAVSRELAMRHRKEK